MPVKRYKILPEWFPQEMDKILVEKEPEKNIHWNRSANSYLLNQITVQLIKMRRLDGCGFDNKNLLRNCCHIANYAMMIADNIKKEI